MPSSRQVGRAPSSGSRVHREYSLCRAVMGWILCARRRVCGLASDSPRKRTFPALTRSLMAPTVSSMGVFRSTLRDSARPSNTSAKSGKLPGCCERSCSHADWDWSSAVGGGPHSSSVPLLPPRHLSPFFPGVGARIFKIFRKRVLTILWF